MNTRQWQRQHALGDFNFHSSLWDTDEDVQLFTLVHNRRSKELIWLATDYSMDMALLKGIPTIEHFVTKCKSRTDNAWSSMGFSPMITWCNTDHTCRFTHTDHYSINTIIDLLQILIEEKPMLNFHAAEWNEVCHDLEQRLKHIPLPDSISDQDTIKFVAEGLTQATQQSIKAKVKINKPSPHSKGWWNSNLD